MYTLSVLKLATRVLKDGDLVEVEEDKEGYYNH